MARGGRREGAGRKSRLTTAERGLVGAECERLYRQKHGDIAKAEVVRAVSAWASGRLPHAGAINEAMTQRCWAEHRERFF